MKYPECKGDMFISFPTLCLESSVRIECSNRASCTYAALSITALAMNMVMDIETDSRTRNTYYALNSLYILSFIASGDGGTEAARLFGLLGLPNSTTMQS